MRTLLVLLVVLAAGGAAAWFLSAPQPLAASAVPTGGDAARGEAVFWAGGCAACHAAPGATGEAKLTLAGGLTLHTPLGPIVAPNISPSPAGIGDWSDADFANAVLRGISPDGTHYTPAFPWTSYRNMRPGDVADLRAYLATLPPSDDRPDAAGLPFPFGWRRPIGLWKRFALTDPPPVPQGADEAVTRGHYLTVALGHCGECHTPRTVLMAMDPSRWLAGAPNPDGDGTVPNITPARAGLADWPAADIAYLLESGFTPDFDSVGGSMAPVVDNWSHVDGADRAAVAAYLKAIAPVPAE
ncbi:c-type cytochrome [Acuticoccus sp. I52.16.1]|uniref:c-type cytochrome n=1 Tax=Acuticoccus sp. I52.16.1 TaxID=2928472 RepID=UPI001FD37505|nr:cytochrome c [Acuticoccus sp. I52.16.1]UOM34838.1 cytochrome c [Acuticoccus sp. I52.16.1]